jgi:hypothetical protein
MLLNVTSKSETDLQKLMAFAKEHHIELSFVDEDMTKLYLPGKSLSERAQKKLIKDSRSSGKISLHEAHHAIKLKFNGDSL